MGNKVARSLPALALTRDTIIASIYRMKFKQIADFLLDACLPPCCVLCGEIQVRGKDFKSGDGLLCAPCRTDFFSIHTKRCPRCALPLPSNEVATLCGDCLQQAPHFDATCTAFDYAPPFDELVVQFKFHSQLHLSALFATSLRDQALVQAQTLPDLLCPVPLGRLRLCERGYNQSLEISRHLSKFLGIPCHAELLVRVKETLPQSSLPQEARHLNLRDAFTAHPEWQHLIEGRHIGVIDDVMTTGSTLNETAACLKHFGAKKVSNFVFARTPRNKL